MLPWHLTTATLLKADHYHFPKQSWSLTGPLTTPNVHEKLTRIGFFRSVLLLTNTHNSSIMLSLTFYFIPQNVLCLASSLKLLLHLVHTNGTSLHRAHLRPNLAQTVSGREFMNTANCWKLMAACTVQFCFLGPSFVRASWRSIFLLPPREWAIRFPPPLRVRWV